MRMATAISRPGTPIQRHYAFREDRWDGMGYEIGNSPLPAAYWQAVEAGKTPEPPRRDNPLFAVIRPEFGPP